MNILFYRDTRQVPFLELYKSLNTLNNKIWISNHKKHIEQFEAYKDRILNEAIGVSTEDKFIIVPEAVRKVFIGWLTEKYGDDAYHISDELPDIKIIGADELNNFLQQLDIASKEPDLNEVSFGQNFFECFWRQLKFFFDGLKQVGALFDPMQGGIFFMLIVPALLIIIMQTISAYQIKQFEKQAELKLKEGEIEEAKELAEKLNKNHPISIAIAEIEAAKQYISFTSEISSQRTDQISPPIQPTLEPPIVHLCYVVQSGDVLGKLTSHFYGTSSNAFMKRVIKASLREKNGSRGVWNTNKNKIDPYDIDVDDSASWQRNRGRLEVGWELVIPNPTSNQEYLARCRFSQ